MPWEQTSAMDQRVQFIADWLSEDYTKMDLCRAYGISRPTADKWIQRYQQGGVEQLEERSRAAHCHPNQTSEEIRQMLIDTKPAGHRQLPGTAGMFAAGGVNWPGPPIPQRVRFSSGSDWSNAGLGITMSRPIVNRSAIAKDPIRSGVRTSREISLWATIGAAIR